MCHGRLRHRLCQLQRNGERRLRGGRETRPDQLRHLRLYLRDRRRDPLRDEPERRTDRPRRSRVQRWHVCHRLLRSGVGRLQRRSRRRLRNADQLGRQLRDVRNGLRGAADVSMFDAGWSDGLRLRGARRLPAVNRRQSAPRHAPRQTREAPDGDATPPRARSVHGERRAATLLCAIGRSGRVRKSTRPVASSAAPTARPTSATMYRVRRASTWSRAQNGAHPLACRSLFKLLPSKPAIAKSARPSPAIPAATYTEAGTGRSICSRGAGAGLSSGFGVVQSATTGQLFCPSRKITFCSRDGFPGRSKAKVWRPGSSSSGRPSSCVTREAPSTVTETSKTGPASVFASKTTDGVPPSTSASHRTQSVRVIAGQVSAPQVRSCSRASSSFSSRRSSCAPS